MMMTISRTPLLEIKQICKRFGAIQALVDVDFDVYPGEVVGLVGDNGAGKTTLVKCIAGILPVNCGSIFFEGQMVNIKSPKDALDLGIQTVYQDLSLCDNIDVVANMFLGREKASRQILDEVTMEKLSIDVLEKLAIFIPSVRNPIFSMSSGQRQSVAIARTLIWDSRIVILDEPTASLGAVQSKQVLEMIKRLRQQGLAVVVISHNLAHIFEVVDRIFVLHLGRNNGVFYRETSRQQILAAISGESLQSMTQVHP